MAHILIVDDEKEVLALLTYVLEKEGHRVTAAPNGAEALALAGVEPHDEAAAAPDLVILDVMMPVMDGYTVCERLRADARTRATPVIVLTAKGGMRDLFSLSPNVAAYVDKPFDPKALRELIAGKLRARETPRG